MRFSLFDPWSHRRSIFAYILTYLLTDSYLTGKKDFNLFFPTIDQLINFNDYSSELTEPKIHDGSFKSLEQTKNRLLQPGNLRYNHWKAFLWILNANQKTYQNQKFWKKFTSTIIHKLITLHSRLVVEDLRSRGKEEPASSSSPITDRPHWLVRLVCVRSHPSTHFPLNLWRHSIANGTRLCSHKRFANRFTNGSACPVSWQDRLIGWNRFYFKGSPILKDPPRLLILPRIVHSCPLKRCQAFHRGFR